MTVLHTVLVVCHWIGLGALLIGYGLSMSGAIRPLMVWGARLQLLIGLALVVVAEMNGDPLNHAKVGVKLLVAIVVVGLCEVSAARARRGEGKPVLTHAAAAATALNVLVAMLWN